MIVIRSESEEILRSKTAPWKKIIDIEGASTGESVERVAAAKAQRATATPLRDN